MSKKTLMKFYGEWCNPCKILDGVIQNVDLSGVEYENIDISEAPDITAYYRVRAVPTMILLDEEGNELKRFSGTMNADALTKWIE